MAQTDPEYLVVDHFNGNPADNRLENLVPSHNWCNTFRATIEQLHIPWSKIAAIPVTERRALRITAGPNRGQPSKAAYELAGLTSPEQPVNPPPPPPSPPPERKPVRDGWTTWADDLFHPPADLAAKYPDQLRGLLP